MTKRQSPGIEGSLAKLAQAIADSALNKDIAFDQQLDAFKALSGYFIGISKVKAKLPEEDEGETFNDIKSRLQATDRGRPGAS